MKKDKLFICRGSVLTLKEIVEMLNKIGIDEDKIYEAIPATNNNRMCMALDVFRNIHECKCGNSCCKYKPLNGKFGRCAYNRKVKYITGKKFYINKDGELTQVIQKKLWIAANKNNRICITDLKPKFSPCKTYWIDQKNKGFIHVSKTLSKELFPDIKFENSPQEAEITIKIKQKQI